MLAAMHRMCILVSLLSPFLVVVVTSFVGLAFHGRCGDHGGGRLTVVVVVAAGGFVHRPVVHCGSSGRLLSLIRLHVSGLAGAAAAAAPFATLSPSLFALAFGHGA